METAPQNEKGSLFVHPLTLATTHLWRRRLKVVKGVAGGGK